MTARELFAVIIRTIGLLWFVVGVIVLVLHSIDWIFLGPDSYMRSGFAIGGAHMALGLALFLSTNSIVRLVYGPDPLS